MNTKPLVLTPRAARWIYQLIHDPRIGVPIADMPAASEAVAAIDTYVAKLPKPPAPAIPTVQELVNGAAR